MMRYHLIIGFLVAFAMNCLANNPLISSENADCRNAIYINTTVFGPTNPPKGYGEVMEFSGNELGNPYFIQREHHTVWYYFDIKQDGILTFEIVPTSLEDDYDFMLFKYTNENFCETIKTQNLLPARTNISRNNPEIGSRTGLAYGATKAFVPAGLGEDFSKPLEVIEGERFYLLVDNVYDGGDGHTLLINFPGDELKISFDLLGEITAHIGHPASLILSEAESGETILDTIIELSLFNNTILVQEDGEYLLSLITKGFFHQTLQVSVPVRQNRLKFSPVVIETGRNVQFRHINFFTDQARIMPQSYHEMYRLYRTLVANPELVVRIEGHVNAPNYTNLNFFQNLSVARARTIRNFLINKGIDEKRLQYIGYGNTRMLFPEASTDEQRLMNRRVEVYVIAYK